MVSPVVLAGAGGAGEGEFGSGEVVVPGAVVGPGLEDQDDGVVEGASPGVVFAVGVALCLAVLEAGSAQRAEGDGVAAGFGEEVAAPAERVCGAADAGIAGGWLAGERARRRASCCL